MVNYLLQYEGLDFEANYEVKPYFIDIAFPKHKVGLEIDGYKYHSTQAQKAKDHLREEYLTEVKGWKIERVPGWLCYRSISIAAAKVLRHIPEVADNKLFIDACIEAKQWFARDLLAEGKRDKALAILTDLTK